MRRYKLLRVSDLSVKSFFVVLLCLLISACARIKIESQDKGFQQQRDTVARFSWADPELATVEGALPKSVMIDDGVRKTVEAEMQKLGYSLDRETPEFLIDYRITNTRILNSESHYIDYRRPLVTFAYHENFRDYHDDFNRMPEKLDTVYLILLFTDLEGIPLWIGEVSKIKDVELSESKTISRRLQPAVRKLFQELQ